MITLSTATVEMLKAELERRERVAKLPNPVPLAEPDFGGVIHLAHAYIKAIGDGDGDLSDYKILIFEAAITAVYGLSVWRWINAKQP